MSKDTSIWGTPRRAGAIPVRLNWPILLFWAAIGRSPCKTCIVTSVWLSAAVENVCAFLHGMVVFASISFVITPPSVSIPRDNGVTSRRTISPTPLSLLSMAPWILAPTATTSSGFTPFEGTLPKKSWTACCTAGIRLEPPTRITSSMSDVLIFASATAFWQGSRQLCIKSWHKLSNFARVKVFTRCLGIPSTTVI